MKQRLLSLAEELKPQSFPLEGKLKSISNSVLKEHRDVLYRNYLKNYNKMIAILEKTDFSKIKDDLPNSQFAQLKRRITWAANGAYLHQLYFSNLGAANSKPGKNTLQLIKQDYQTLANFKDHFISTGFVPVSGWIVWGYSLFEKKTYIAAIESHHDNTPIGFFPILVIDMWEHAYWKDHFTKKKEYLKLSWNDINWDEVEKRAELVQQLFIKL
jgi:Fe-Mn family superoxide dismutase